MACTPFVMLCMIAMSRTLWTIALRGRIKTHACTPFKVFHKCWACIKGNNWRKRSRATSSTASTQRAPVRIWRTLAIQSQLLQTTPPDEYHIDTKLVSRKPLIQPMTCSATTSRVLAVWERSLNWLANRRRSTWNKSSSVNPVRISMDHWRNALANVSGPVSWMTVKSEWIFSTKFYSKSPYNRSTTIVFELVWIDVLQQLDQSRLE